METFIGFSNLIFIYCTHLEMCCQMWHPAPFSLPFKLVILFQMFTALITGPAIMQMPLNLTFVFLVWYVSFHKDPIYFGIKRSIPYKHTQDWYSIQAMFIPGLIFGILLDEQKLFQVQGSAPNKASSLVHWLFRLWSWCPTLLAVW